MKYYRLNYASQIGRHTFKEGDTRSLDGWFALGVLIPEILNEAKKENPLFTAINKNPTMYWAYFITPDGRHLHDRQISNSPDIYDFDLWLRNIENYYGRHQEEKATIVNCGTIKISY